MLGDLRNISCTMLPSKIYESYVLNWLALEVTCKSNQYGGVKGCSVSHLLVDLWDEALWNLEDERAATLITSIDYAKAFNRLSFQHCLRAFARKGASSQTISLLATFLSNRVMTVRVGDVWSTPRPVYGGVPQVSILGVLLFNISTDDLEDESVDGPEFIHDEDVDSSRSGSSSSGAPLLGGSESGSLGSLDEDADGPPSGTPVTSTPNVTRGRPRFRESPLHRLGPRLTNRDWSFMPGRTNRRRRRNLKRRINYSDEGEMTVPLEVNEKATGLRWKKKPARKFKYVDDGMITCKINMRSGRITGVYVGGREVREKQCIITQNMFRRVVERATGRGMVVNNRKTNLLCISDAMSYKGVGYIRDAEGQKLVSSDAMKVLGFHFDSRPSCHAHVEALRKRMRETSWVLRHLKLAGFRESELAVVYTTVVRPVLDYCAVVYHSMLTDEQDQQVERLQAQALKCIYGYKMSYKEMRDRAGITTHQARRVELCDKFAEKAATSGRFSEAWFPLREGRQGGRRGVAEKYKENG